MEENNKYSVLMSVYHKEKPEYLKLSIDSMLMQTISPEQIVLVEDGTLTEELEDVVKYYEQRYPKVFDVIRREENRGLGYSLNEGLEKCRNELVARMDSDDISLPERCEKQLRRFGCKKNLCVVGGQINEFSNKIDNVVSQRKVPCKYSDIQKFSKRRSPFNHPTVMYKKSIILKMGGYPIVNRKEDLKLFLNLVFQGYLCENLEEVLVLYRANEENLQRRRNLVNCREYISIMYQYFREGNISAVDFIYVFLGQVSLYIFPSKVCKFLSNIFLRTIPKVEEKNE